MKRNRFLKVSRRVFAVLAWVALSIGGVSSVVIFVNHPGPWEPRFTAAGLSLLAGIFYFFVFGTVSEIIRLLLDMAARESSR